MIHNKLVQSNLYRVFQLLWARETESVRRKGANKKTMNIQDILHIILHFEVEDIPCFVARDLSNLPPLTQDHFDLASVMRNLFHMQHELSTLATLKDDMTILQAQMTDFTQRRHADDSDNQIIQTQDDERSADPVLTPRSQRQG